MIGTTKPFNKVELNNPPRMTWAIGLWISLPGRSPPTANGIKARAEVNAVIKKMCIRDRTCIEIIYLRKQKSLLDKRLANAETMFAHYKKRFESGDANQLELNKIQLELLNAQNQSRLNKTALTAAEEQLRNLNGGGPIPFDATNYPEGEDPVSYTHLFG